jgi:anti-sigma B factor antagonist
MAMRGELSLDLEITASDRVEGYVHTVVLAGELDVNTSAELLSVVERLLAERARELVLDIGALAFIDTPGLRAILTIRELCQRDGCEFGVTLGQENVQRLFKLTGLDSVFPFRPAGAGRRNARESYVDTHRRTSEGAIGEYLRGVKPRLG